MLLFMSWESFVAMMYEVLAGRSEATEPRPGHGQWVRNKTRVRIDATDGISTILRDVTLLLS